MRVVPRPQRPFTTLPRAVFIAKTSLHYLCAALKSTFADLVHTRKHNGTACKIRLRWSSVVASWSSVVACWSSVVSQSGSADSIPTGTEKNVTNAVKTCAIALACTCNFSNVHEPLVLALEITAVTCTGKHCCYLHWK
jgi:hypothetical protein